MGAGALTPGVPRRDVGGGLMKSSGRSFQLLMLTAFDGGGRDGEELRLDGGGPAPGFGAAEPYIGGGAMRDCCRGGSCI